MLSERLLCRGRWLFGLKTEGHNSAYEVIDFIPYHELEMSDPIAKSGPPARRVFAGSCNARSFCPESAFKCL